MTTKTCTGCGETKSTDQFHKNRKGKYGVSARCKACIAAQKRAYKEAHWDKIAAQKRAHYESNRDKINARQRAHYEANREEVNARNRAYYEANRVKIIARHRAYNALVGDPSTERSQEVTARYSTRTRDPWTPEEDRYVLTGPGTIVDKALQLSRTYNAVVHRATTLRRQDNAA